MGIPIPPGVYDILPYSKELWRTSSLWQYVESMMRETAKHFNFHEMRTPVIERTELFKRGVGETTDVVAKEMYTFEDKGGRSLSLRPEGTAPAIRSFIENQLHVNSSFHKLFYIGPMFRYERAQAGRYRQHHQFGIEAIGVATAEQDIEVIDLIYLLFCKLGLKNLKVNINSVGDAECRLKYRTALLSYLEGYFNALSEDSQIRFKTNPLRILDSKHEKDREIISQAPSILDFLNSTCKSHFERLLYLLEQLSIPYQVNDKLVRGLDYYTKTVFEITTSELGAQNSLVGGGRYDGLIKTLGGPDLPAMGFGCGIERVLQTMLKQNCFFPSSSAPQLFLIALGEVAKENCFKILHESRLRGINAQMDFTERKLAKIMQEASAMQAKYVSVIGDNELQTDQIELKEMASGHKQLISKSHLWNFLLEDLHKK